jgi:hypothetical protein
LIAIRKTDLFGRKRPLENLKKKLNQLSAFALFAGMSLAANGQILSVPNGRSFQNQPKFDARFISVNKISEIEIIEQLKPDGQKIKDTGNRTVYRFNEKGTIHSELRIIREIDTLITIFEYVGDRLNCVVRNDAAGLYSYCYTYADGRPTQVKYARLSQKNGVESKTEINTESFQHKEYEGQLHTTQLNTAGRPYRKEIRYYDADGYYTRFVSDYVMTSKREEEFYEYNIKGLLSTRKVVKPGDEFKLVYEYDDIGNLIAEERYEGEEKLERKEYVYEKNMLLKAELTRDEIREAIRINTYNYQFRK